MHVPKAMLLRLLRTAMVEGSITRGEIDALCPPQKTRRLVPREILDAARSQAVSHKLEEDDLRFGVQLRAGGYKLILVRRSDGKTPARGLGVLFAGTDDVQRAADDLILQYLKAVGG